MLRHNQLSMTWMRGARWFMLAAGMMAASAVPASAADSIARFEPSTFVRDDVPAGEKTVEGDLSILISVPRDGTGPSPDPVPEFEQAHPGFLGHLRQTSTYQPISDWPSLQGITPLNTDNPPFTFQAASAAWIAARPKLGPGPFDVPRLKVQGVGGNWAITVRLHGIIPKRGRGEIRISPLEGWKYSYLGETAAITGSAVVRYSQDNSPYLQRFRGKLSAGWGTGGPSVEFSGEGVLQQPRSTRRSRFTTLSVDGKIPVDVPKDVADVIGAKREASGKIADTLSIALNRYGYRRGGKLVVLGLRGRTTGGFHGAEAVGYYAPLMGWFDETHGFYAAEIEAGWRDGDAEFTDLRTKAPDRGHWVARLGTVVEWAPKMRGINRDLSKGFRFYVRGRGWLDSFKNAAGDAAVRLRGFADGELFYNFSDQWRFFVRGEYGYVPPELNKPVSRPFFFGVGAAF